MSCEALPSPAVLPEYEGGSLLNLHYSIRAAFGAAPEACAPAYPPVDDAALNELLARAERVVLVVIDALGYRALESFRARGALPLWDRLAASGLYRPLTTVFPSATNVVLTSLHTGLAPLAHGVPGYRLYLREADVVGEMISFRVIREPPGAGPAESLFDLGVRLEDFAHPTLVSHLAAAGVPSVVLFRHSLIASHLSLLNHAGATRLVRFVDTADQMVQLRRLLEDLGGKRGFVYTYWDAIDSIQHLYGAAGDEVEAEAAKILFSLERELLARLPRAVARGTVLLVVSDHGQVTAPPESCFPLHAHPELTRLIAMPPGGNARVTYLRAKPGRAGDLEGALRRLLPGGFHVATAAATIRSGLLGRGAEHPEVRSRMGDLVVFAPPAAGLFYHPESKEPLQSGKHGGLTPEEMLVPLLAVELGEVR